MDKTRTRKAKPVGGEREYFESQATIFAAVSRHATDVNHAIGRHLADPPRGMATWIFMRLCVAARSLEQLHSPPAARYGIQYLDHASIAGVSRSIIETAAVLLYIGDVNISSDLWWCRKWIIDLHDCVNRGDFLALIGQTPNETARAKAIEIITEKLEKNDAFKLIPAKRRKRLLNGDDMFIDGRHAALCQLGWGSDFTRGLYKYLSQQAHSQSMSFHRTEVNSLYVEDSPAAQAIAGFATEFARRAIGTACVRIMDLFPPTELALNAVIVASLRKEYDPGDDPLSVIGLTTTDFPA